MFDISNDILIELFNEFYEGYTPEYIKLKAKRVKTKNMLKRMFK